MPVDTQDLDDQIAHLDSLIAAYRAALKSFATNGAQQRYSFDSGQQKITVEREEPSKMRGAISSMMNEKQILCQRKGTASGTLQTRGGW